MTIKANPNTPMSRSLEQMVKEARPTFFYEGMPVRAAGILLWTQDGHKTLCLLNKCNRKFEDLGGKTDVGDTTPLDTAIREACEETNNSIFSNKHTFKECAAMLYEHAVDSMDAQYNDRSKYLLFRVYVHPSILSMDMRRFGRTEKTEWGILNHYFQWRWTVPFHNQLHPRLRGLKI
jgi:hypothetical protein